MVGILKVTLVGVPLGIIFSQQVDGQQRNQSIVVDRFEYDLTFLSLQDPQTLILQCKSASNK